MLLCGAAKIFCNAPYSGIGYKKSIYIRMRFQEIIQEITDRLIGRVGNIYFFNGNTGFGSVGIFDVMPKTFFFTKQVVIGVDFLGYIDDQHFPLLQPKANELTGLVATLI